MKTMKPFRLSDLSISHSDYLTKKAQNFIMGGNSSCDICANCFCGFVGGAYEYDTFPKCADTFQSVLIQAGEYCHGLGATCWVEGYDDYWK